MSCTSLALQKNQKAHDILHIHQDYSVEDPWPHLHQIVQMSDDIVDPQQMQLENRGNEHITGRENKLITLKKKIMLNECPPSNFFTLRDSNEDSSVDSGEICTNRLQDLAI